MSKPTECSNEDCDATGEEVEYACDYCWEPICTDAACSLCCGQCCTMFCLSCGEMEKTEHDIDIDNNGITILKSCSNC